MTLAPRTRLGPYEIVGSLGAGGMGEVYRARDTRLGREVAIKVLPAEFARDPERLRRFELEARSVAALNHPNILALHDVGTHEGAPYLVTELLEGESLYDRLRAGALPVRRTVEIGVQIAQGLAAAHEKGIVHRDLKPGNVFVTKEGHVKILDFGLAKLAPPRDAVAGQATTIVDATEAGTTLGTAGYMSPEQVRGQAADQRSDIFSFGCVLYEMVSGRRAFAGDTAADTMSAVLSREPELLELRGGPIAPAMQAILGRCLAKRPEERFDTARDLAFVLRALDQPRGAGGTGAIGGGSRGESRPSIAVLPFLNLSADPEQEFFCDGMAEEIINALARVHGLRVIARTSSFAFKGRNEDIREIGAKLDVAALLEGSVRKSGDRLRIAAQLINVADGSHLWSERYDRRPEDVFAIQSEIALAIVDSLEVRLLGRERTALGRRPTGDLDAYSAYLEGLHHWNKLSPDGFARSRASFEKAIRIDPSYAPAYSGLAMWYSSQAFWGDLVPQVAWLECRAIADRALALDPDWAYAYVGRGSVLAFGEHRWPEAEDDLRRAVALGPSIALAHMNLAGLLVVRRAWDEAAAEARIASRLDPLSVPNCAWSAGWLDAAGRSEEAAAELDRIEATDPTHWLPHWELCLLAARAGRFVEARGNAERAVALSSGSSAALALLACCAYRLDDPACAERVRDQLQARARQRHVPPSFFGWIDAARHDIGAATDRLARAAEDGDPWFPFYRVIPALFLPADATIEALLGRFGL